jgi:two-component system nitrate/nitrite response regulator NarL
MTSKLVTAFQAMNAPAAEAAPVTPTPADPLAALSPREQQILQEIARGASNKEIARTLGVAESTVKIHVQHILRKLELTSRVQVAVYASERGYATRA